MQNTHPAVPLLALALLVLPVFAAPASAVVGFTQPAQDQQIIGTYGPGSPFGTWTTRNEWTTWHVHSSCPGQITPTSCDYPTGGAAPVFTYDTERGGDPATVVVTDTFAQAGPVFAMDPPACSFGVLDDVRLYQLRSQFLLTGDMSADFFLRVTVFATDASCNTPIQIAQYDMEDHSAPMPGSPIDQRRTLTGEYTFPDPLGYVLPVGYHLRFQFQAFDSWQGLPIGAGGGLPVATFNIEVDDPADPSVIEVLSNSARVNLWTQNRFGVPTQFFPPSSPNIPSQDRQIFLRMIEFNPWGHEEGCGGLASTVPPDSCPHDSLWEQSIRLRVQDVDTTHQAPAYCNGSSFDPCYNAYLPLDQGLGLQSGDPSLQATYIDCCTTNIQPPRSAIEYLVCPPTGPGAILGCPNPPSPGDLALGMGRYHYTLRYDNDPRKLPDGQYRITMEDRRQGWIVSVPLFIGVGGFDFTFAPSEPTEMVEGVLTAAHTVGLREPTKYKFLVKNNGFQTNTYGFAAPTPGLGWTASVAPSSLTLAPGQTGEVEMTVFPANAAVAGDFKIVSIVATSSADNLGKTLYTKTTLTGTRANGPVTVSSSVSAVEIRPNLAKIVPFTMRNGGTHQDSFVITAVNLPQGWVAAFTPPYLTAFGASSEGFTMSLRAPAEAPPNTSFNLIVKVCRSLDATNCGQLSLPIIIIAVDGIEIRFDPRFIDTTAPPGQKTMSMTWHDAMLASAGAGANSIQDRGFDASALFRIEVENTGDRQDAIQFFGAWAPNSAFGVTDAQNCDGSGVGLRDGIPDGWRYRILDHPNGAVGNAADPGMLQRPDPDAPPYASSSYSGIGPSRFTQDTSFTTGAAQTGVGVVRDPTYARSFSGERAIGTLVLPPHTTQYVYVELAWTQPGGAGCAAQPAGQNFRTTMPSAKAEFRLSHRSTNDQSIRGWTYYRAELTHRANAVGQGGYSNSAIFNVQLERALNQEPTALAPVASTDGGVYGYYARNLGTEYDNIKVNVDDGHNGWTHEIILGGGITAPMGPYLESQVATTWGVRPAPHDQPTRGCTLSSDSKTLICRAVGVGEAIAFQVVARPPSTAAAGELDDMTVTAASMKGLDVTQNIFSRETVRTMVRGTYAFQVDNPDPVKVAYRTQTIAFPFTIRNVGQQNDVYYVSLVSGDASWNPVFSMGSAATVPADHDLHGFLAVTVPNNAPLTRQGGPDSPDNSPPQLFHVKIESDGVGTATQLHFLAPTVPAPSFTIAAQPLTIPSGQMDAIVLQGTDNGGNLELLRLDGHYRDFNNLLPGLPRGWSFVCLPVGHASYDQETTCEADESDTCHDPPTPSCNYPGRTQIPAPFLSQLEVKAGVNQLGNSRVAHRIQGSNIQGGQIVEKSFTDAVINLQSTYGVSLHEAQMKTKRIIPPGNAGTGGFGSEFQLVVANTGLTPQSVLLTTSALPGSETATTADDWSVSFEASQSQVAPLNRPPGYQAPNCTPNVACEVIAAQSYALVDMIVRAPPTAPPGAQAKIIVYGTVQEDNSQVASLELTAEVGRFSTGVTAIPATNYQSPGWNAEYVLEVKNAGTVDDTLWLTMNLPTQLQDAYRVTWNTFDCDVIEAIDPNDPDSPLRCVLQQVPAGRGVSVRVKVFVPELAVATAPGADGIPITMRAQSLQAPSNAIVQANLFLKVLDFRRADIDGDGIFEYAVDGCSEPVDVGCNPDPTDGFELYREAEDDQSSIRTSAVDVRQFLNAKAREENTQDNILRVKVDVNGDGFVDHFIDSNGDGLADRFWSPAGDKRMFVGLPCAVDVTGDGLGELFVDFHEQLQPDGIYDFAYDMANAKSYRLFGTFADGGETLDYVVDVDGDGDRSVSDPVIFGLRQVDALGTNVAGCVGVNKIELRVDMDGKNGLDLVIGDGVGTPLYFLRNKGGDAGYEEGSYIITLRDVTGDGKPDWTYDFSGKNGKPNAYYDPETGETGLIDTQGEFLRDLAKYWYVGIVFAIVVVLFVVLVMVTRK